jgi:hypothetical protein
MRLFKTSHILPLYIAERPVLYSSTHSSAFQLRLLLDVLNMFGGLKIILALSVYSYLRITFCSSIRGVLEIPKCCAVGEKFNGSMACVTSDSDTEDWEWVINNSIALNHELTFSDFSFTTLANTSLSCPPLSR